MKVVRPRRPRRRDGVQQVDEIRGERDKLVHYVAHDAANLRLQLMAFGAKQALDWVLDNRQGMAVTRLLNLTEFALKLKRRRPLRVVPTLERVTHDSAVEHPGAEPAVSGLSREPD